MKKNLLYSLGLSSKTFSSNFTTILAILVISILTITPKFYNGTYLIGLWGLFIVFEFNKFNRINGKLRYISILGIIFVLICIIYKLIGVSSASMGYCISSPLLFFAPVSALMVIDRCHNKQQMKFLFHFLALAIAINIADNIRLGYEYGIENLVFQNLGETMEEEGLTGLNFGGSLFVNMAVFYSCVMFMAFLKSNNKKEKLLFLIYVGISFYFIVMCTLKASAVILTLIGIASMYISVKSKKNAVILLLLMAVVGGLLFFFMDSIINILIEVIGSDRVSRRLFVFTSEGSMEDSSSFSSRSELWMVSLQSWLRNVNTFFFGTGDHNWSDFITTSASGVGNHSDILDVLARYGIFGAFIMYSSIIVYYNYQEQRYGKFLKYEIQSFFILFILMAFTKRAVHAQPAIVLFILFPLCLRYFYGENKTV